MQRLLDEQAAKARAVDEQVAGDHAAVGRVSRDSMKPSSPCCCTSTTLPSCRFTPQASAMLAQERGVQPGIEMIGIGDAAAAARGRRAAVARSGRRAPRWCAMLNASGGIVPPCARCRSQKWWKIDAVHLHAVVCRRDGCTYGRGGVQSTNSMPSLKLACVARMNSASSICIVRLKSHDRRNGGFTDAHRADLLRLDQLRWSSRRPASNLRERGRRHPAGGAATDDHDSFHLAAFG